VAGGKQPRAPPRQSRRRPSVGAARLARRAGIQAAAIAAHSIATAAPENVGGSVGVTSYSSARNERVSANDAPSPITTPAAASPTPYRTINHCTWLAAAPSAIRMPISRRRRRTSWATTPYTPTTPSAMPTKANASMSVVRNRSRASAVVRTSSIVRMDVIASAGSSLDTIPRIAGARAAGSPDVRIITTMPPRSSCGSGSRTSGSTGAAIGPTRSSPTTPTIVRHTDVGPGFAS
jgi:hypothetical protein